MKTKKYFLLLLSILSIGGIFLSSCGNQNDKQINSIEEIKNYPYNLGVLQGTYSQEEVPDLFPKSRDKEKIFVYEDVAGAYRALQQGKIDVLFQDRSAARVDLSKGIESVKILDGIVGKEYNALLLFIDGMINSEGLEWESNVFRKKGMPSISNRISKEAWKNKMPVKFFVKQGKFLVIVPVNAILEKVLLCCEEE